MSINFLTIQEFADRMKVHPATVRKFVREGKVFASRTGTGKTSRYRIAESELERLHLQSMCEKQK